MKKYIKIFSLVALLGVVILLTGCSKKENKEATKTLSYDGDKIKATFKVSKDADAKLSKGISDTRTSREKAMIIAKDFRIGIEENDDLGFSNYSGDFDKYKKNHTDGDEYESAKFGEYEAFVQYYGGYVRYEVYLKLSDKYILKLNIYPKSDSNVKKEDAKKQYDSKVVQDILKNIKASVK